MPECRINLAHVVTYLSEAPKSTRALEGYNRACELAKQEMTLPVPELIHAQRAHPPDEGTRVWGRL